MTWCFRRGLCVGLRGRWGLCVGLRVGLRGRCIPFKDLHAWTSGEISVGRESVLEAVTSSRVCARRASGPTTALLSVNSNEIANPAKSTPLTMTVYASLDRPTWAAAIIAFDSQNSLNGMNAKKSSIGLFVDRTRDLQIFSLTLSQLS